MMALGGGGGDMQGTPQPSDTPSDNLYMKGFPPGIDENTVKGVISPYGNVMSVKVLPPSEGRNFTAVVIRMSTMDEAKWLVEHMNGNMPEGMTQPIEVKY